MHSSGTVPSLGKWKLLYLQHNKGQSEKHDISINSAVLSSPLFGVMQPELLQTTSMSHWGLKFIPSLTPSLPHLAAEKLAQNGIKNNLLKPQSEKEWTNTYCVFPIQSAGKGRKIAPSSFRRRTFFSLLTNSPPILSLLHVVFSSTELDATYVPIHSPHLIL